MRVVQVQSAGEVLVGLEIERYPEGLSEVWCHGLERITVPTGDLVEVPRVEWGGSDHVAWEIARIQDAKSG